MGEVLMTLDHEGFGWLLAIVVLVSVTSVRAICYVLRNNYTWG
jgi:hypothetical protein